MHVVENRIPAIEPTCLNASTRSIFHMGLFSKLFRITCPVVKCEMIWSRVYLEDAAGKPLCPVKALHCRDIVKHNDIFYCLSQRRTSWHSCIA